MTVAVRAPFLAILAGLAAMLAVSDRLAPVLCPFFALLTALGVLLVSFRVLLPGQRSVAVLVAVIVFLGSVRAVFVLNRPPSIPSFVKTTGTVVGSRPWGRLHAVAVKTEQGGFVLQLPFASLPEGERIRLEGVPKPFRGGSPKSDFREDRFWYARGMIARLTSVKFESLPNQAWNIHRWRHGLYRSLTLHTPRLTGAYLNAAWTGKRDTHLNDSHKRWGTSHLLAVSGFHVGIVMLGASLLFRRGRGRVACLSLLLWFYVLSTGAEASAVRAGLMIQIALLGETAGRPGSAINSVSLAAVLLLMYSPFYFWDIGWRLSVSAALVIAAVAERSAPGDAKPWLFVSPLIWLATFPQVAWTFGSVPLAGILINFFAPPFFGFALSFASIAAVLRLIGIPGAGFLLYALEGAFELWGSVADLCAYIVPWQMAWDPFFAYCCTGIFIGLLCRALLIPWRNVAFLVPVGSLAAFALFAA